MNATTAQPVVMPSSQQHSHRKNQILNLPNALTALRILSVPVIILLMYDDPSRKNDLWAAILFGAACVTDFADGIIARRTGAITRLGRVLDPIADKLIVLTVVILLVSLNRLNVIVGILLLGREIAVNGLRGLASQEGIEIPSSMTGKVKVWFEGFGLAFLLVGPDVRIFGVSLMLLGTYTTYAALGLALWSGTAYFVSYFRAARRSA